jgi:hypothetical protein
MKIIDESSSKYYLVEYYVGRSIRFLGIENFGGISRIVLEDNDLTDDFRVLAKYFERSHTQPAFIKLFVKEIYRGVPFPFNLTPAIFIRFVRVLAHQMVYHMIANGNIACKLSGIEENLMADSYANELVEDITKSFRFRIWAWILRHIAGWHFSIGQVDFKQGDVESAKDHFYTASQLDPNNAFASEWFWYLKNQGK